MIDNRGWIKDWRKTLDWGWFTDVPTAHFWEYVRLRANRETNEWMGESINEGEFISSVERMSIESGLSPKQIRLAIKKLEKTGEIETVRTNRYTLIRIVKWPEYQGLLDDEGKQTETPKAEQKVEPRGDKQEDKKRRREEFKENTKEKIRPSLDDVIAYCRERRNGVDPQKWFDYYSANGWKVGKNPMKDWKACVRTWERNNPKPQEEPARRYEQPW